MAIINGNQLTTAQNDLLVEWFNKVSDKELEELSPELRGGYKNLTSIREYIINELRADKELNKTIARLIYDVSQYKALTNTFSFNFLVEMSDYIAGKIGTDKFLLTLILAKYCIEDKPIASLDKLAEPDEQKIKRDEGKIKSWLNNVLLKIDIAFDSDSASKEIIKLRQQCEELRKKIDEQKRSYENVLQEWKNREVIARQQTEQKHSKKIADYQSKIDSLNAEINKLKKEYEGLLNRYRDLNRKYEELEKSFDQSIEKRVEEEISKKIRPWLSRRLDIEKELSSLISETNSLIEKADLVLKKQAEADRSYGTRLGLLARLKELKNLKKQLNDALVNSLQPLPILKDIISEVEAEIDRLRKILHLDNVPSEDSLCDLLFKVINTSDGFETLNQIEQIIRIFRDINFISFEDAYKFYDRLYEKWSYIADLKPQTIKSSQDLFNCIYRNKSSIIYLDAHNILHQWAKPFEGLEHKRKREKLTEYILKLSEFSDKVKFIIVFDGHLDNVEKKAENVTVIYSGGKGAHRADERICRELENKLQGQDKALPTFVISDDMELRSTAERYCATAHPVAKFVYILSQIGIIQNSDI